MTRSITTAAELEALPVGSGIVDKHGDLGLIDRVNREIVVQYAQAGLVSLANAKRYLPATVVHDPSEARTESTPAQVVSDAAVEAGARALCKPRHRDPDGWPLVGVKDYCGRCLDTARAALTAALPFLTMQPAPEASREDVTRALRSFLPLTPEPALDSTAAAQAAALFARFVITERGER